ncbi:stage III sporulation protein AF [Pontibacillus yanchengensis]|uniref:Stage III sporulation protein AF n=2 Tax=Pontibacillus yanchengensis TaxID=462910 RepID=A0ACC7VFK6_9BACI|nr:stage III sporulation protein AF [Pontibacillus yanchengensis]MYL33517.1 stage III sporulation protein AF [Pontibacillus yanchengensis]MYL53567.1 stage III sporulation protein AF [Pontibacillus yanchengensis]
MEFITEWVTQIILFLLLAFITDLILPTSSLRKYIKLVVGLLLILVFLQPVFQLFEVDVNRLFSQEMKNWENQSEVENMENLIDIKKKEIQASQRAYILEQMAVQLENSAKEELMDEHEVEILNFSFQFSEDEQDLNLESLEQLTVVVSDKKSEKHQDEVGDVEDIEINFANQTKKESNSNQSDTVKKFLSTVWQIPIDKINIQWEGGVQ